MFEGWAADLLAASLGRFVDVQRDRLRISLWSGSGVLENVRLRSEAFDYLKLPFAIHEGVVGRLRIKIPWGNWLTGSLVVELSDVLLCATEREDSEWEESAALRREQAAKQADLAAAELAKLSRRMAAQQLQQQQRQPHAAASGSTQGGGTAGGAAGGGAEAGARAPERRPSAGGLEEGAGDGPDGPAAAGAAGGSGAAGGVSGGFGGSLWAAAAHYLTQFILNRLQFSVRNVQVAFKGRQGGAAFAAGASLDSLSTVPEPRPAAKSILTRLYGAAMGKRAPARLARHIAIKGLSVFWRTAPPGAPHSTARDALAAPLAPMRPEDYLVQPLDLLLRITIAQGQRPAVTLAASAPAAGAGGAAGAAAQGGAGSAGVGGGGGGAGAGAPRQGSAGSAGWASAERGMGGVVQAGFAGAAAAGPSDRGVGGAAAEAGGGAGGGGGGVGTVLEVVVGAEALHVQLRPEQVRSMLQLTEDLCVWVKRNRYGRFRPPGWCTAVQMSQVRLDELAAAAAGARDADRSYGSGAGGLVRCSSDPGGLGAAGSMLSSVLEEEAAEAGASAPIGRTQQQQQQQQVVQQLPQGEDAEDRGREATPRSSAEHDATSPSGAGADEAGWSTVNRMRSPRSSGALLGPGVVLGEALQGRGGPHPAAAGGGVDGAAGLSAGPLRWAGALRSSTAGAPGPTRMQAARSSPQRPLRDPVSLDGTSAGSSWGSLHNALSVGAARAAAGLLGRAPIPATPAHAGPITWTHVWQYAGRAVLHDLRERRTTWSLRDYLASKRQYMRLYRRKLEHLRQMAAGGGGAGVASAAPAAAAAAAAVAAASAAAGAAAASGAGGSATPAGASLGGAPAVSPADASDDACISGSVGAGAGGAGGAGSDAGPGLAPALSPSEVVELQRLEADLPIADILTFRQLTERMLEQEEQEREREAAAGTAASAAAAAANATAAGDGVAAVQPRSWLAWSLSGISGFFTYGSSGGGGGGGAAKAVAQTGGQPMLSDAELAELYRLLHDTPLEAVVAAGAPTAEALDAAEAAELGECGAGGGASGAVGGAATTSMPLSLQFRLLHATMDILGPRSAGRGSRGPSRAHSFGSGARPWDGAAPGGLGDATHPTLMSLVLNSTAVSVSAASAVAGPAVSASVGTLAAFDCCTDPGVAECILWQADDTMQQLLQEREEQAQQAQQQQQQQPPPPPQQQRQGAWEVSGVGADGGAAGTAWPPPRPRRMQLNPHGWRAVARGSLTSLGQLLTCTAARPGVHASVSTDSLDLELGHWAMGADQHEQDPDQLLMMQLPAALSGSWHDGQPTVTLALGAAPGSEVLVRVRPLRLLHRPACLAAVGGAVGSDVALGSLEQHLSHAVAAFACRDAQLLAKLQYLGCRLPAQQRMRLQVEGFEVVMPVQPPPAQQDAQQPQGASPPAGSTAAAHSSASAAGGGHLVVGLYGIEVGSLSEPPPLVGGMDVAPAAPAAPAAPGAGGAPAAPGAAAAGADGDAAAAASGATASADGLLADWERVAGGAAQAGLGSAAAGARTAASPAQLRRLQRMLLRGLSPSSTAHDLAALAARAEPLVSKSASAAAVCSASVDGGEAADGGGTADAQQAAGGCQGTGRALPPQPQPAAGSGTNAPPSSLDLMEQAFLYRHMSFQVQSLHVGFSPAPPAPPPPAPEPPALTHAASAPGPAAFRLPAPHTAPAHHHHHPYGNGPEHVHAGLPPPPLQPLLPQALQLSGVVSRTRIPMDGSAPRMVLRLACGGVSCVWRESDLALLGRVAQGLSGESSGGGSSSSSSGSGASSNGSGSAAAARGSTAATETSAARPPVHADNANGEDTAPTADVLGGGAAARQAPDAAASGAAAPSGAPAAPLSYAAVLAKNRTDPSGHAASGAPHGTRAGGAGPNGSEGPAERQRSGSWLSPMQSRRVRGASAGSGPPAAFAAAAAGGGAGGGGIGGAGGGGIGGAGGGGIGGAGGGGIGGAGPLRLGRSASMGGARPSAFAVTDRTCWLEGAVAEEGPGGGQAAGAQEGACAAAAEAASAAEAAAASAAAAIQLPYLPSTTVAHVSIAPFDVRYVMDGDSPGSGAGAADASARSGASASGSPFAPAAPAPRRPAAGEAPGAGRRASGASQLPGPAEPRQPRRSSPFPPASLPPPVPAPPPAAPPGGGPAAAHALERCVRVRTSGLTRCSLVLHATGQHVSARVAGLELDHTLPPSPPPPLPSTSPTHAAGGADGPPQPPPTLTQRLLALTRSVRVTSLSYELRRGTKHGADVSSQWATVRGVQLLGRQPGQFVLSGDGDQGAAVVSFRYWSAGADPPPAPGSERGSSGSGAAPGVPAGRAAGAGLGGGSGPEAAAATSGGSSGGGGGGMDLEVSNASVGLGLLLAVAGGGSSSGSAASATDTAAAASAVKEPGGTDASSSTAAGGGAAARGADAAAPAPKAAPQQPAAALDAPAAAASSSSPASPRSAPSEPFRMEARLRHCSVLVVGPSRTPFAAASGSGHNACNALLSVDSVVWRSPPAPPPRAPPPPAAPAAAHAPVGGAPTWDAPLAGGAAPGQEAAGAAAAQAPTSGHELEVDRLLLYLADNPDSAYLSPVLLLPTLRVRAVPEPTPGASASPEPADAANSTSCRSGGAQAAASEVPAAPAARTQLTVVLPALEAQLQPQQVGVLCAVLKDLSPEPPAAPPPPPLPVPHRSPHGRSGSCNGTDATARRPSLPGAAGPPQPGVDASAANTAGGVGAGAGEGVGGGPGLFASLPQMSLDVDLECVTALLGSDTLSEETTVLQWRGVGLHYDCSSGGAGGEGAAAGGRAGEYGEARAGLTWRELTVVSIASRAEAPPGTAAPGTPAAAAGADAAAPAAPVVGHTGAGGVEPAPGVHGRRSEGGYVSTAGSTAPAPAAEAAPPLDVPGAAAAAPSGGGKIHVESLGIMRSVGWWQRRHAAEDAQLRALARALAAAAGLGAGAAGSAGALSGLPALPPVIAPQPSSRLAHYYSAQSFAATPTEQGSLAAALNGGPALLQPGSGWADSPTPPALPRQLAALREGSVGRSRGDSSRQARQPSGPQGLGMWRSGSAQQLAEGDADADAEFYSVEGGSSNLDPGNDTLDGDTALAAFTLNASQQLLGDGRADESYALGAGELAEGGGAGGGAGRVRGASLRAHTAGTSSIVNLHTLPCVHLPDQPRAAAPPPPPPPPQAAPGARGQPSTAAGSVPRAALPQAVVLFSAGAICRQHGPMGRSWSFSAGRSHAHDASGARYGAASVLVRIANTPAAAHRQSHLLPHAAVAFTHDTDGPGGDFATPAAPAGERARRRSWSRRASREWQASTPGSPFARHRTPTTPADVAHGGRAAHAEGRAPVDMDASWSSHPSAAGTHSFTEAGGVGGGAGCFGGGVEHGCTAGVPAWSVPHVDVDVSGLQVVVSCTQWHKLLESASACQLHWSTAEKAHARLAQQQQQQQQLASQRGSGSQLPVPDPRQSPYPIIFSEDRPVSAFVSQQDWGPGAAEGNLGGEDGGEMDAGSAAAAAAGPEERLLQLLLSVPMTAYVSVEDLSLVAYAPPVPAGGLRGVAQVGGAAGAAAAAAAAGAAAVHAPLPCVQVTCVVGASVEATHTGCLDRVTLAMPEVGVSTGELVLGHDPRVGTTHAVSRPWRLVLLEGLSCAAVPQVRHPASAPEAAGADAGAGAGSGGTAGASLRPSASGAPWAEAEAGEAAVPATPQRSGASHTLRAPDSSGLTPGGHQPGGSSDSDRGDLPHRTTPAVGRTPSASAARPAPAAAAGDAAAPSPGGDTGPCAGGAEGIVVHALLEASLQHASLYAARRSLATLVDLQQTAQAHWAWVAVAQRQAAEHAADGSDAGDDDDALLDERQRKDEATAAAYVLGGRVSMAPGGVGFGGVVAGRDGLHPLGGVTRSVPRPASSSGRGLGAGRGGGLATRASTGGASAPGGVAGGQWLDAGVRGSGLVALPEEDPEHLAAAADAEDALLGGGGGAGAAGDGVYLTVYHLGPMGRSHAPDWAAGAGAGMGAAAGGSPGLLGYGPEGAAGGGVGGGGASGGGLVLPAWLPLCCLTLKVVQAAAVLYTDLQGCELPLFEAAITPLELQFKLTAAAPPPASSGAAPAPAAAGAAAADAGLSHAGADAGGSTPLRGNSQRLHSITSASNAGQATSAAAAVSLGYAQRNPEAAAARNAGGTPGHSGRTALGASAGSGSGRHGLPRVYSGGAAGGVRRTRGFGSFGHQPSRRHQSSAAAAGAAAGGWGGGGGGGPAVLPVAAVHVVLDAVLLLDVYNLEKLGWEPVVEPWEVQVLYTGRPTPPLLLPRAPPGPNLPQHSVHITTNTVLDATLSPGLIPAARVAMSIADELQQTLTAPSPRVWAPPPPTAPPPATAAAAGAAEVESTLLATQGCAAQTGVGPEGQLDLLPSRALSMPASAGLTSNAFTPAPPHAPAVLPATTTAPHPPQAHHTSQRPQRHPHLHPPLAPLPPWQPGTLPRLWLQTHLGVPVSFLTLHAPAPTPAGFSGRLAHPAPPPGALEQLVTQDGALLLLDSLQLTLAQFAGRHVSCRGTGSGAHTGPAAAAAAAGDTMDSAFSGSNGGGGAAGEDHAGGRFLYLRIEGQGPMLGPVPYDAAVGSCYSFALPPRRAMSLFGGAVPGAHGSSFAAPSSRHQYNPRQHAHALAHGYPHAALQAHTPGVRVVAEVVPHQLCSRRVDVRTNLRVRNETGLELLLGDWAAVQGQGQDAVPPAQQQQHSKYGVVASSFGAHARPPAPGGRHAPGEEGAEGDGGAARVLHHLPPGSSTWLSAALLQRQPSVLAVRAAVLPPAGRAAGGGTGAGAGSGAGSGSSGAGAGRMAASLDGTVGHWADLHLGGAASRPGSSREQRGSYGSLAAQQGAAAGAAADREAGAGGGGGAGGHGSGQAAWTQWSGPLDLTSMLSDAVQLLQGGGEQGGGAESAGGSAAQCGVSRTLACTLSAGGAATAPAAGAPLSANRRGSASGLAGGPAATAAAACNLVVHLVPAQRGGSRTAVAAPGAAPGPGADVEWELVLMAPVVVTNDLPVPVRFCLQAYSGSIAAVAAAALPSFPSPESRGSLEPLSLVHLHDFPSRRLTAAAFRPAGYAWSASLPVFGPTGDPRDGSLHGPHGAAGHVSGDEAHVEVEPLHPGLEEAAAGAVPGAGGGGGKGGAAAGGPGGADGKGGVLRTCEVATALRSTMPGYEELVLVVRVWRHRPTGQVRVELSCPVWVYNCLGLPVALRPTVRLMRGSTVLGGLAHGLWEEGPAAAAAAAAGGGGGAHGSWVPPCMTADGTHTHAAAAGPCTSQLAALQAAAALVGHRGGGTASPDGYGPDGGSSSGGCAAAIATVRSSSSVHSGRSLGGHTVASSSHSAGSGNAAAAAAASSAAAAGPLARSSGCGSPGLLAALGGGGGGHASLAAEAGSSGTGMRVPGSAALEAPGAAHSGALGVAGLDNGSPTRASSATLGVLASPMSVGGGSRRPQGAAQAALPRNASLDVLFNASGGAGGGELALPPARAAGQTWRRRTGLLAVPPAPLGQGQVQQLQARSTGLASPLASPSLRAQGFAARPASPAALLLPYASQPDLQAFAVSVDGGSGPAGGTATPAAAHRIGGGGGGGGGALALQPCMYGSMHVGASGSQVELCVWHGGSGSWSAALWPELDGSPLLVTLPCPLPDNDGTMYTGAAAPRAYAASSGGGASSVGSGRGGKGGAGRQGAAPEGEGRVGKPAFQVVARLARAPGVARSVALHLLPRYLVHNGLSTAVQLRQQGTSHTSSLAPGQRRPIHWADTGLPLRVQLRVQDPGWSWSGGVAVDTLGPGDLFVKIRHRNRAETQLVRLDVSLSEGGTLLVSLSHHHTDFAPYRIDNCSGEVLHVQQVGCLDQEDVVRPYACLPYTWDEHTALQRVLVSLPGRRRLGEFELEKVGFSTEVNVVSSQTGGHGRKRLRVTITADGPTRVLQVVDLAVHPLTALPATAASAQWSPARARGGGGGGTTRRPGAASQHAGRPRGAAGGAAGASGAAALGGGGGSTATAAAGDAESWSVEVTASVAGVGVSVVSERVELLYALLQGASASLRVSDAKVALSASLQHVRWDNTLRGAAFPIMLYSPVGRSLFHTAVLLLPPPLPATWAAQQQQLLLGQGQGGTHAQPPPRRPLLQLDAPQQAASGASEPTQGSSPTAARAAGAVPLPGGTAGSGAAAAAAAPSGGAPVRQGPLPPPAASLRLVVWRNRPGGVTCVQQLRLTAAPFAVSVEEVHVRELLGVVGRMRASLEEVEASLGVGSGAHAGGAGAAGGPWASPGGAEPWQAPQQGQAAGHARPDREASVPRSAAGGPAAEGAPLWPPPPVAPAGLWTAPPPLLLSPTARTSLRPQPSLQAAGVAASAGAAATAVPSDSRDGGASRADLDGPPGRPVGQPKRNTRVYIEELHIGEIRISASFAPRPYAAAASGAAAGGGAAGSGAAAAKHGSGAAGAASSDRGQPPAGTAGGGAGGADGGAAGAAAGAGGGGGGLVDSTVRLLMSLAHLEGAWVTLRPLDMRYALMGHEALVQNVLRHYMSCALLELIKVVGALDIFGDVVRLLQALGVGAWHLLSMPVAGALRGDPISFAAGVLGGVGSMARNVAYATSNSVVKASRRARTALAHLAPEPPGGHHHHHRLHQHAAGGVAGGGAGGRGGVAGGGGQLVPYGGAGRGGATAAQRNRDLLVSTWEGYAAIVQRVGTQASRLSVRGTLRELLYGGLGAVALPTMALLQLVETAASSIRASVSPGGFRNAHGGSGGVRLRVPRFVDPGGAPLQRYCWLDSLCRLLQQEVDGGAFAGEEYVGGVQLAEATFALVTRQHLVLVSSPRAPADPRVAFVGEVALAVPMEGLVLSSWHRNTVSIAHVHVASGGGGGGAGQGSGVVLGYPAAPMAQAAQPWEHLQPGQQGPSGWGAAAAGAGPGGAGMSMGGGGAGGGLLLVGYVPGGTPGPSAPSSPRAPRARAAATSPPAEAPPADGAPGGVGLGGAGGAGGQQPPPAPPAPPAPQRQPFTLPVSPYGLHPLPARRTTGPGEAAGGSTGGGGGGGGLGGGGEEGEEADAAPAPWLCVTELHVQHPADAAQLVELLEAVRRWYDERRRAVSGCRLIGF